MYSVEKIFALIIKNWSTTSSTLICSKIYPKKKKIEKNLKLLRNSFEIFLKTLLKLISSPF